MARPKRLPDYSYCGLGAFFLTFCTDQRARHFVAASIVDEVLSHFLRCGDDEAFQNVAYCFMPDHMHMLVMSLLETANLIRFAKMSKQRSGLAFRRDHQSTLWQPGYVDRVLRSGESMVAVARYIIENPVRAGLVSRVEDYPFWGSSRWTREELLQMIA